MNESNLEVLSARFPSSAIFDAIQHTLSSSEEERSNAIKQSNAIFAFVLTNDAGDTDSWNVDLKKTGTVGKGLGNNATGE